MGRDPDETATGTPARVRSALAARFGVDPRALAALRVSLGVLLLADLALRADHLVAFHADSGVLPHAVLREQFPAFSALSVHLRADAAWMQAGLFVLAGAFAVALLAGYRTRLATAGSLALLVSLQVGNPLVLNAGDRLLRRLLFWGLFLPLGGRWSADALRRGPDGTPARRSRVATPASAALLVQVLAVYATNAVYKLRAGGWAGGGALRYALELDSYATPLGDVLAGVPGLLAVLGWTWLALVVASPLLVGLTGRPRGLLVGAFVAGHLGMALTMSLGLFPLVSVVALLPFLPARVWDAVERRAPRPLDRRLVGAGLRERIAASGRGEPGLFRRGVARWGRRGAHLLAVAGLLVLLVWNAAALGYVDAGGDPSADLSEYRWDMFANPPSAEGWYVAEGRLASGRTVGGPDAPPGTWGRLPPDTGSYPDARWRKYVSNLRADPGSRRHVADYLCTRWNAGHDARMVELTLSSVERRTRLDGPDPTERTVLGTYRCGSTGR